MNAILLRSCTLLAALAPQEPARILPTLQRDATLTLTARWEPCRSSKYGVFAENEVLRAPRPAEERHTYTAAELAPLLPREAVAVGDTWPVPRDAVLPLLRQFHPGASTALHDQWGTYPGTFACLRAASDERVEILFRSHAEFELERGIRYIPAQFEGRLVLASGAPLFLRLALPDRDTNVDVNVPMEGADGPGGPQQRIVIADIGWVPRMELTGGTLVETEVAAHAYARSIADADARMRIARQFYPFARVDWLPFADAVRSAREQQKPLHVVVLFGTLDDESC